MKIVVIGGSGFIGTRLVRRLLESGHDVKIFDKRVGASFPEITTRGDVRDKDALTAACKEADVVYNLAAEHADDVRPVSLYYDVNVGGARNTVEAALSNDVKHVIFTSSVALYGLNVGVPDESYPARPFNDYGKSKWQAEQIFQAWANEASNRTLVIIRPVVIFGENNRGNVYNLIRQVVSGRFVQVGTGQNVKSMGYVGNIAKYLEHSLGFGQGIHLYNYADKPDLTTAELIEIVRKAAGQTGSVPRIPYTIGLMGGYVFDAVARLTRRRFPISSIRIKKFCANTEVSADKLITTGFKPDCSLEDGLKQMIRHEFGDTRAASK